MNKRKRDHIDLAGRSQASRESIDKRFTYEPVFNAHPEHGVDFKPFSFMGKMQKVPLWVSSITGGTNAARSINENLAKVCAAFGIGMGLGSCRVLLDDDSFLADFDVRHLLGDDLPLYANLGIAQVERLTTAGDYAKIRELIEKLRADGLIIHVNPLQEWLQPEGDRLAYPPIDTIKAVLDNLKFPVAVKEVGQGMGPESIRELLKLPLQAIELGAYGGTNFTQLELVRSNEISRELFDPVVYVGHDAEEMTDFINQVVIEEKELACREIIISGGIKNFLDGYYLVKKCTLSSIYGQAFAFLKYASEGYDNLHAYVDHQVRGYRLAATYLSVKVDGSGD